MPVAMLRRLCLAWCCAAAVCVPARAAPADSFDAVIAAARARDASARAAQQAVDQLADRARDLSGAYLDATHRSAMLTAYNARIEQQIVAQETRRAEIEGSLARLTGMQREVLPMLARMLDALDRFIALDLPFQTAERHARVRALRALLDAPQLELAEKYRRILDAYRVEEEYGRTLASWHGRVEFDGSALEVELLRIGRIGLFCRSADGNAAAYWDARAVAWRRLGDSAQTEAVRRGIAIALGARADTLLMLPVAAPERTP